MTRNPTWSLYYCLSQSCFKRNTLKFFFKLSFFVARIILFSYYGMFQFFMGDRIVMYRISGFYQRQIAVYSIEDELWFSDVARKLGICYNFNAFSFSDGRANFV